MQLDIDVSDIRFYLEEKADKTKPLGVNELAEATGIPKKRILHLLKENRLIVKNLKEGDGVPCEMCGRFIEYGKICDSCKATLANQLYTKPQVNRELSLKEKKDAPAAAEKTEKRKFGDIRSRN
jgi:hypothetical protein